MSDSAQAVAAQPAPEGQAGASQQQTKTPGPAPWYFWVNLGLVVFLWWELQWANDHVYRHNPFLPMVSPELFNQLVNWMFGFFLVSFIATGVKGKLSAFATPAEFMNPEAYRALSHKASVGIFAAIAAILWVIVWSQGMLHLVYDKQGEKPVVEIKDEYAFFSGDSIPLIENINPTEIIVTDRYDLYRASVDSGDLTALSPVFPSHRRVDLDKYFISRDFNAVFKDAHGDDLGQLEFKFSSKDSLERQCEQAALSIQDCYAFFRAVFQQVDNATSFHDNHAGAVRHKNRWYQYEYKAGPIIQLLVTASIVTSELANSPSVGFETYWKAGDSQRLSLIKSFREDVEVLADQDLTFIYDGLWKSKELQISLKNGTPAKRKAALRFVVKVLPGGVDYVAPQRLIERIRFIADNNMHIQGEKPNEEEVFVRAAEAICLLADRAGRQVKEEAISKLEGFINELGDLSNHRKPDLTRILLRMVNQRSDEDHIERVLDMISILHKTGTYVQDKIRKEVSLHADRVTSQRLFDRLRRWNFEG